MQSLTLQLIDYPRKTCALIAFRPTDLNDADLISRAASELSALPLLSLDILLFVHGPSIYIANLDD
jgi:hypothetical protein